MTGVIQDTGLTRPQLTLPEAEADALRAAFERAGSILEYGAGGSTVMAAEMPGKRVWSIESDRKWVEKLQGWFAAHGIAPGASVTRLQPGEP